MTLQDLYNNDKEAIQEIQKYLTDFLKEYGVAKIFRCEPTENVGEAKKIIDEAFENLDLLFGTKKKKKKVVNESR